MFSLSFIINYIYCYLLKILYIQCLQIKSEATTQNVLESIISRLDELSSKFDKMEDDDWINLVKPCGFIIIPPRIID